MTIELPPRDGDGYLKDMDAWSPEVARAMAEADQFELTGEKWAQILKAREYYDEHSVVPP
ncbi:MAG: TusE/DsrC/DsvC family sulfur relay protein, partial [Gammaproteobacteria bacterium]|nr:TusE/DsrC/DsvC family sulfur relay protein [Gammaproteobacteria bacterium]